MELPFSHSLRFTNEGPIGLSELGQTLIAHEIVFQLLPNILERAVPGLTVSKFEFELVRIIRNSPAQEEFAGRFFVNVQKSLEDFIHGVGERTGVEFMKTHSHALSLLVIAMLITGGLFAWQRLNPTAPAQINIQGDHNVVLNLAAEPLGLDANELRKILDDALSAREKRQLEKAAASVFAPSKAETGATVEVPDAYRVSPEAAKAIPTLEMLEDAEPLEEYETINEARVTVRATNLDDREQGWAGLISVGGKNWRLRLFWPANLDLDYIKKASDDMPIVADVRIVYRPNRRGEFVPKLAEILKVHFTSNRST